MNEENMSKPSLMTSVEELEFISRRLVSKLYPSQAEKVPMDGGMKPTLEALIGRLNDVNSLLLRVEEQLDKL